MAAGDVRTPFSPENFFILASGVPLSSYSDGDFATLSPNADLIDPIVGADGESTANLIANNTGQLTVRIAYNSPARKLLNTAATLTRTSGVFAPTSLFDAFFPESLIISARSCILRRPDEVYSAQAASMFRSYKFHLFNIVRGV